MAMVSGFMRVSFAMEYADYTIMVRLRSDRRRVDSELEMLDGTGHARRQFRQRASSFRIAFDAGVNRFHFIAQLDDIAVDAFHGFTLLGDADRNLAVGIIDLPGMISDGMTHRAGLLRLLYTFTRFIGAGIHACHCF